MNNLRLSWSGYNNFLFCPQSFFINYLNRIEIKEEFKSSALRNGTAFHELVLQGKRDLLDKLDPEDILKIEILAEKIGDFLVFKNTEQHWEKKLNQYVTLYGTIDCWLDDETFGDLKLTSNPQRYLNEFGATGQLQVYFTLVPDSVKYAYFLPIRFPESYVKKTEELGDFEARLNLDVEKRMNYYFPLWRKDDRSQQIFGYKYYRSEFENQMKIMKENILQVCRMIWSCHDKMFFPRNYKSCWQCSYEDICRINGENTRLDEIIYDNEKYIKKDEIKY